MIKYTLFTKLINLMVAILGKKYFAYHCMCNFPFASKKNDIQEY